MDEQNAQVIEDVATVADLKAQLAQVEAQLVVARKAARKEALAKIQELMAEFDIKEVFLKTKGTKEKGTRGSVAPKYQNPLGEGTWTGRGKTPLWVKEALHAGYTSEDMLIKK